MTPMFLLIELQALNPLDPRGAVGKTGGLIFRDVLLILGVALFLTVLLVVWATRFARRRKHHRHHTTPQILHKTEEASGGSDEDTEEGEGGHRHRRRRRHRRDHRGRNPTLAETGGLPPVRSGPPETPIA